MNIKLNRNHFSADEIFIPEGEEFSDFRSHADGSRRIRPKGKFILLEGIEETVRSGGETFTVSIPAGTYKMVHSGSMYSHVIIRRVDD